MPIAIAYTSQSGALATEQLLYRNGFLSEVCLHDGTLIYRHDEENALGQLTKLTTGSMQRDYEFSDWGIPVRRSITRANEIRGLTEDFSYDGLNRLSTYGNKLVEYDDRGNILSKGNAGELVYTNPNRPYAVTGLTPVAESPAKSDIDITYTSGERPSVITDGSRKVVLTYNANHDRVRMAYSVNDLTLLTRYYLGGNYESDVDSAGIEERLYLGGNYYDAPAVLIKQNGHSSTYFIHRDYLGNVLQIADSQGNIVEENSFDAWGCRRNPVTQEAYASGTAPELMLGRGYTGHEHLDMFGLINMNARLYDPVLGRFISPDPYVQMQDFTQAFNRYSYCMNSPLCYVDENGEFFLFALFSTIKDAFVNTFIRPWSEGFNAWSNKSNWHSTSNAWKMTGGLFKGGFDRIISRFTWELPQTFIGYLASQGLNLGGGVKSVSYYEGATVSETYKSNWGAFTMGSFILGSRGIKADPYNSLFQHEYGHYLQSRSYGLGYISKFALPSLFDTFSSSTDHNLHPIEQDANARAFRYFNENVDGFYKTEKEYDKGERGWNFEDNPLNISSRGLGDYVDYGNADQMKQVDALKQHAGFFDYIALGTVGLHGVWTSSLFHHVNYNKTKSHSMVHMDEKK